MIQVGVPLALALVSESRASEGVARLRASLLDSHRERMHHTHVLGLDVTAAVLKRLGEPGIAEAVLDAANVARRRVRIPRSPSELLLLQRSGLDPRSPRPGPLRLQSSGALSEWLGETLERAL